MEAGRPEDIGSPATLGHFRRRRFLTGVLILLVIGLVAVEFSSQPFGMTFWGSLCALTAALAVVVVFELVVRRRNPGW